MEQKTRVEKYKKHRDEISKMDTYRVDSPYAIPEDDLVLDPFMGRGTSIISCIHNNRHGIGLEKDDI